MQRTKLPTGGYIATITTSATESANVQIQNTIDNMRRVPDGYDIRKYSDSARKELLAGGTIQIMSMSGTRVLEEVPKLALVVVSSVFREHLEHNPNATTITVFDPFINYAAVSTLLQWVNTITKSSGEFSVSVVRRPIAIGLIKIYHAAHHLGMERYVDRFSKTYKDGLIERIPITPECLVLERCSLTDCSLTDWINALGARLAYLRRVRKLHAVDCAKFQDVFSKCHKLAQAVRDADARLNAKRGGVLPE
ncbi:hypothetical protein N0V83_010925 [Neocucurbitaria cava]|uniref:Uncharacterized protein n=1 Tax=Neocucurbitaria cava TaxID=798079 RepID=A0A9W8XX75_9PLEO|nr:hypothetical protein N0V83_010925 [Neocucurbitaria cava]